MKQAESHGNFFDIEKRKRNSGKGRIESGRGMEERRMLKGNVVGSEWGVNRRTKAARKAPPFLILIFI